MSMNTHKLLSQVSENKRDIEADALQKLVSYRLEQVAVYEAASAKRDDLLQQRELQMNAGTQVSELAMLEQCLFEQTTLMNEVEKDILALDLAIYQQKKKWSAQHKKHKRHEEIYKKIEKKEKLMLEQKQQKVMDDQFSQTRFAKGKVEN